MDTNGVEFRKAELRPIDFLMRAKELIAGEYWLFLGISFVGMFIAGLFAIVLLGPMMCGVYLCYLKKMRGEEVTFQLLFKGFDYFVESLIATLLLIAASLVVSIPLLVILFGSMALGAATGEEEGFILGLIVGELLYFLAVWLFGAVVWTFFGFTYPLIVEHGMKAMPAVRTSIKAARANLPGLLIFWVTLTLITILCMACCYLPAVFISPLTFGALALAYREVFPEAPTAAVATDQPEEA